MKFNMKKNIHDLIAEQYLEVLATDDGAWIVNLVMESMPQFVGVGETTLKYCLATFRTMEEGDEFADAYRFLYDKSIFKYELM
jgi:hypothetical protein